MHSFRFNVKMLAEGGTRSRMEGNIIPLFRHPTLNTWGEELFCFNLLPIHRFFFSRSFPLHMLCMDGESNLWASFFRFNK